jgi:hypothetical protein
VSEGLFNSASEGTEYGPTYSTLTGLFSSSSRAPGLTSCSPRGASIAVSLTEEMRKSGELTTLYQSNLMHRKTTDWPTGRSPCGSSCARTQLWLLSRHPVDCEILADCRNRFCILQVAIAYAAGRWVQPCAATTFGVRSYQISCKIASSTASIRALVRGRIIGRHSTKCRTTSLQTIRPDANWSTDGGPSNLWSFGASELRRFARSPWLRRQIASIENANRASKAVRHCSSYPGEVSG